MRRDIRGHFVSSAAIWAVTAAISAQASEPPGAINSRIFTAPAPATTAPAPAEDLSRAALPVPETFSRRIPDVVGTRYETATQTLSAAGFTPKVVYLKHDGLVPPMTVVATDPPAGEAVAGDEVTISIPRPASRVETAGLRHQDFERREGFDLDAGRYQKMTYGADVMVRWRDFERRVDQEANTAHYIGRGYYLQLADGAAFIDYRYGEAFFAPGKEAEEIGGAVGYASCRPTDGVRMKPTTTRALYLGEKGPSAKSVCVRTSEGNIALLSFDLPWADEVDAYGAADVQFRYALFPKQDPSVRALQRSRLEVQPRAPQPADH